MLYKLTFFLELRLRKRSYYITVVNLCQIVNIAEIFKLMIMIIF